MWVSMYKTYRVSVLIVGHRLPNTTASRGEDTCTRVCAPGQLSFHSAYVRSGDMPERPPPVPPSTALRMRQLAPDRGAVML